MNGILTSCRRFLLTGILATAALLTSCSKSRPSSSGSPDYRKPTTSSSTSTSSVTPIRRVVAGSVGPSLYPSNAPFIHAKSAIMIDAKTGRTIYQKYADSVRGAASTQKLLTAMVVIDSGNLNAMATVSQADTRVEPSKLYVRAGDSYSRRSLLTAFLVKSSNDVALTLARDNAGSISAFCAKMNAKARSVGAMRSNFTNPHGLTGAGQYSCARDVARFSYAAYKNPVIRDIVKRKFYRFTYNSGKSKVLENTNKLLGAMPEASGMKTGYTKAAGRCLVSSAKKGFDEVILVQLGSETKYIFNDAYKMMQWGLNKL